MDLGLLLIRLAVGLTFAAHGSQKLFGWFGGGGVNGTASMMEQLGLRPGRVHAQLAGLAEFCGGLFFAFGLLLPLAAAALVAVMLVAVSTVHIHRGFFNHNGGFEYNLVLTVAALAVVFMGPGAVSVDWRLGLYWYGLPWGLASLAVGLLAGNIQLLARHAMLRAAGSGDTTS